MPKSVELLKVFVASPSDTQEERNAINQVIDMINKSELSDSPYHLERVAFETDVHPDFGLDAQSVINEQIGDNWDIFIGILKTKFGTPTGRAGSGTEEEFNNAFRRWNTNAQGCKLMVYFGSEMISTSLLNSKTLDEIQKVKGFQEKIAGLGLYWVYSDIHSFKDLVRSHLVMVMKQYKKSWGLTNKSVALQDVDTVQVDEYITKIQKYYYAMAQQSARLSVVKSKLAQFFLTNSEVRAWAESLTKTRTEIDEEWNLFKNNWFSLRDTIQRNFINPPSKEINQASLEMLQKTRESLRLIGDGFDKINESLGTCIENGLAVSEAQEMIKSVYIFKTELQIAQGEILQLEVELMKN